MKKKVQKVQRQPLLSPGAPPVGLAKSILILIINSSPIDKLLGKVPKGCMVRPRYERYEPQPEHVGIHGNPENGNHQALPH